MNHIMVADEDLVGKGGVLVLLSVVLLNRKICLIEIGNIFHC